VTTKRGIRRQIIHPLPDAKLPTVADQIREQNLSCIRYAAQNGYGAHLGTQVLGRVVYLTFERGQLQFPLPAGADVGT
jgi:hypothetical protein